MSTKTCDTWERWSVTRGVLSEVCAPFLLVSASIYISKKANAFNFIFSVQWSREKLVGTDKPVHFIKFEMEKTIFMKEIIWLWKSYIWRNTRLLQSQRTMSNIRDNKAFWKLLFPKLLCPSGTWLYNGALLKHWLKPVASGFSHGFTTIQLPDPLFLKLTTNLFKFKL